MEGEGLWKEEFTVLKLPLSSIYYVEVFILLSMWYK